MSKREVKRKFLLLDLLYRISRGETPYEISKRYGWSRQRLYYWLKKLKSAGLVRLAYRSNIAVYELTPEGKKFYTRYVSSLPSSIRLHNVAFSYPIIQHGELTPDKTWRLKGVLKRLKKEKGCSVVWDDKTMVIHIESLIGDNAFELLDKAKSIADKVVKKLSEIYGFELGEGKLCRKPHFAIPSKLFELFSSQFELTTEEFKIDESEGSGEAEFFTPEGAMRWMELPELIEKQTLMLTQFAEQLELHLSVLKGIKEATEQLSKAIEKLNERLDKLG